jgi:hypothetical protein
MNLGNGVLNLRHIIDNPKNEGEVYVPIEPSKI